MTDGNYTPIEESPEVYFCDGRLISKEEILQITEESARQIISAQDGTHWHGLRLRENPLKRDPPAIEMQRSKEGAYSIKQ